MILEITPIYAVPLAILMLILWINVSKTRAAKAISIGDGGDVALHEIIRRHGNFIEWVPFVLLMMLIAELSGAGREWLHAIGFFLLVSRLIHPFGLKANAPAHVLRIVGNTGSLIALAISVSCIIYTMFA